jgi:hypothetical protein
MNKGIFIDLNALIEIDNKAWIVDKMSANQPILKLSKSDLNLIKSGIYKNQGNKIEFNGINYYLPTNLMNKIKVKLKTNEINISNLAISLQEFMNKDVVDKLKYQINEDLVSEIKNGGEEIYIICSNQTKRSYETILENLKDEFYKNGLKIKTFYPISENFLNQTEDDIKFKKMRLLLQHLVGYKTDGDKFKDEEITRFDQIIFYDNYYEVLKMTKEINILLEYLLNRTEDGLRSVIKEDIIDYRPTLWINKESENKMNKRTSEKVILTVPKIVKTFENFNPYS